MTNKKRIKYLCGWLLAATLLFACQLQPVRTILTLPSHVNMIDGRPHYLPFAYPNILQFGLESNGIVNVSTFNQMEINNKLNNGLSFEPLAIGSARIQLKLLGIIPLQTININVLPELKLVAGGQTLGVYLQTDGILVTGFMKIKTDEGAVSPAEKAGIRTGDYIMQINQINIVNIEDLENIINSEASKNPYLEIVVRKGTSEHLINVKAVKSGSDGKYKIGIYGKNNTSGIGTLTFIDPTTKTFGALGHPVTDPDSNSQLQFRSGNVTMASVTSIEPSKPGLPGQKNAVAINKNNLVGSIDKNGRYGIYGRLIDNNLLSENTLPVALRNTIYEGDAHILTVIEDTKIEKFEIKVIKNSRSYSGNNKGMVIEITDNRLLDRAGGIVQGMSGSPIIQNGHIIGAVTHVFLNNPKRGYGCFIENMVYESELLNIQLRHISTNIWMKRRAG